MKSVLIIEAQMKQYRLPFYAGLYETLQRDGIRLTVAYSAPAPTEAAKQDTCELPPEFGLRVKGYWLWPNKVLYQPLFRLARAADLVIVDTGNKFLLNHLLLPLSRLGLQHVAFWGHTGNRGERQSYFQDWYRRKTLNWVSWWFAYEEAEAERLKLQGVPQSKISVVQNSVDTREISSYVNTLKVQSRDAIRTRLGIPLSASVGVFCGVLNHTKGLPLLIEASRKVKARLPTFHLVVIGGGEEAVKVKNLVGGLDWVHWAGPQFGRGKAELLAVSDVFLLPGAVGLAILDAFAAGLPLLTTRVPTHGPEIEYLKEGVNGLMTEPQLEAYANVVSAVLNDAEELGRLRDGAKASAEKYSIENMVANFKNGVQLALARQPQAKASQKELRVRSERTH